MAKKQEEVVIDESKFLYGKINAAVQVGLTLPELPLYITNNLSEKFAIRDYQKEAFQYTIHYIENMAKNKQIHLLYHMATGSGKTYMMAGLILYYYKKGYRNFLFFVNQSNIVEKTKENFNNKGFAKYLFAQDIVIDGQSVNVNVVDNFQDYDEEAINIKFTTIQKLHDDLNTSKEGNTTLQDFDDIKVVMIADEAHHINADTKKKKTKDEIEADESWEKSVNKVYTANKDNVMFEFTATCDLKNPQILEKYTDKIIYNYDLIKYREDGYTKEFLNFQSTLDPLYRVVEAMLLSQYRLKLFEKYGKNVKPTILLKSQSINENKEFYERFVDFISKEFSESDIEFVRSQTKDIEISDKMFTYYAENGITDEILVTELKQAFSEEHLIIMDSKDSNLSEKYKVVNDLENRRNPYRMIFTVDMLNEGWDVLNLFDIVRLYETRQGGNKISKVTMTEAQLIGRGVRYCPFKVSEDEDIAKRKYDSEEDNEMRICETLYYHSKQDSKYIEELRQALKEIGFEPKNVVRFTYKVKEDFTTKPIFKTGKLFINERREKDRSEVREMDSKAIQYQTIVDLTSSAKIVSLVNTDTLSDSSKSAEKKETFKSVITIAEYSKKNYPVLYKALRQYPIFRFDRIHGYYPNLTSIKEFITSESYAGKFELCLLTDEEPTNIDFYKGFLTIFGRLADKVSQIEKRYEGLKTFTDVPLSKYVKDTERKKANPDNEGEGVSQNAVDASTGFKLDLSGCDWYVYNDNYGTTEEKKFVMFFASRVDELKKKYDEVYLIRNERNLHVYSFDEGRRFEPDYILLLIKDGATIEQQQIFVEPKGSHLLEQDSWKEDFMLQMESMSETVCYNNDSDEFKVLGLPFYNKDNKEQEFSEAIEKLYK